MMMNDWLAIDDLKKDSPNSLEEILDTSRRIPAHLCMLLSFLHIPNVGVAVFADADNLKTADDDLETQKGHGFTFELSGLKSKSSISFS